MKNKWLLFGFLITIIISIFIFIKYDGYIGMFDSFKKDKIVSDTTKIKTINQTLPLTISTIDTICVYRVIVGSFKFYENAVDRSKEFIFSDILPITNNGLYRVSKDYYFNKEEAIKDINNYGNNDYWILEDKLLLNI